MTKIPSPPTSPVALSTDDKSASLNGTFNPAFVSPHRDEYGTMGRIEISTKVTIEHEGTPQESPPGGSSLSSSEEGISCALYKGLLFSAFSSVFFSLSSAIVKYLKDVPPSQLAFFRFLGIFIFNIPITVYHRKNLSPKGHRINLFFRGICGATSLLLRFYAFRYLPIADASVIVFSIPVFVSLFAMCCLKEPCGIFHVVTVTLTFLGMVIITKFPLVIAEHYAYTSTQMVGIVAALSSTFFGAGVYIFLRKLKEIHHSVIMFNFGGVAIVETFIIFMAVNGGWSTPPTLEDWAFILTLGVFSYCGQLLLTLATKSENAGPVAVVRAAVDIVLAFIWQIIFFNETPDIWSISGSVLITSSILVISFRKWLVSQPDSSKMKGYLSFLTQ